MTYSIEIPDDFCYIDIDRISGCDCMIYLKSPIQDWLKENNISYDLSIFYNESAEIEGVIMLLAEEDAMAFKLRWLS